MTEEQKTETIALVGGAVVGIATVAPDDTPARRDK
ncbi:hypothetical protein ANME2D_00541 [Candidatus Methanoperedens nitroreducens]|uniref:Uncharacterized protein n=1 Tax=Candidatus Methanoperedens nitratireducens TaxID=1392998 RepID=A0A062VAG8_9EURY|nr:hypothetical protein ANME2D_00541 [Candidatus Methanoperedens nitroreducens]